MILDDFAAARSRRNDFADQTVVFTNGCFDLLHPGHLHILEAAREQGDYLLVGLNTDDSVQRLKGSERPVMDEQDRLTMVNGLEPVSDVVLFDDDTPARLIETILPDVLVKGADYEKHEIIGGEVVEEHGGRVHRVPLLEGYGTSEIIRQIRGGSK